jgi:ribonuclease D
MDPRSLGVLEHLLAFRQERAAARDRPAFKIMGTDPLKELVSRKPESLEQMQGIPGLSAKMIDRMGDGILAAIRRGLEMPEENLPRFPRHRKPPVPAAVTLRVKALKQWREQQAQVLQLEPGLLLNNALIDQVARLNPVRPADLDRIPELRNWQQANFGGEIVEALARLKPTPGPEAGERPNPVP